MRFVRETEALEPEPARPYERAPATPYISTDRTDLLRLLVRIEVMTEEVNRLPSNGHITHHQFLQVRDEIWSLASIARKVRGRLDAS